MNNLILNSLKTPDGTILTSYSRHDYRTYRDKNGKEYMVDGGLAYLRRSANGDEIELSLYDDEPHQVQREIIRWGTYGKDGKSELTWKKIADMSTDHLEAVLKECSPTGIIKNCMFKELEERGAVREAN